MKLNFPFAVPRNINEGRTEEERQRVKGVLEKAHHAYIDRQKYLDEFIRTQMEKLGCTYTLDHQFRAIGNSAEKWIKKAMEWQEEEKTARTASAAELVELKKSKNPLVKLLLAEPATEPEPTTQAQDAEATGEVEGEDEDEEEALVVKRRRKGKQVVEEDPEEDEEQFYMMEFAMGDTAGNEGQPEKQGEMPEIDEFFNVSIYWKWKLNYLRRNQCKLRPSMFLRKWREETRWSKMI